MEGRQATDISSTVRLIALGNFVAGSRSERKSDIQTWTRTNGR